MGVGKTLKLTPVFTPAETTNQAVEWSSSNEAIVTVDEKGKIKGISVGEAVITCTALDDGGAVGYCEVEVCEQIKEIALDNSYLNMVDNRKPFFKTYDTSLLVNGCYTLIR